MKCLLFGVFMLFASSGVAEEALECCPTVKIIRAAQSKKVDDVVDNGGDGDQFGDGDQSAGEIPQRSVGMLTRSQVEKIVAESISDAVFRGHRRLDDPGQDAECLANRDSLLKPFGNHHYWEVQGDGIVESDVFRFINDLTVFDSYWGTENGTEIADAQRVAVVTVDKPSVATPGVPTLTVPCAELGFGVGHFNIPSLRAFNTEIRWIFIAEPDVFPSWDMMAQYSKVAVVKSQPDFLTAAHEGLKAMESLDADGNNVNPFLNCKPCELPIPPSTTEAPSTTTTPAPTTTPAKTLQPEVTSGHQITTAGLFTTSAAAPWRLGAAFGTIVFATVLLSSF